MFKPKVFLIIMDGFGYRLGSEGNAVALAKKPTYDFLWNNYAHTLLNAFGENVGLPWGITGSSEVGHTSIGSGMLIDQELTRIDKEIENNNFYQNTVLNESINFAKKNNGGIHLIGLVSDGGVHSHERHLYSLLRLIKKSQFTGPVYIHMITDGRDTQPKSALIYIERLQDEIKKIKSNAQIASVGGRYYAMDRDSNWDRVKKAYDVMVYGLGDAAETAADAINAQYAKDLTDEFIVPTPIKTKPISGNFWSKLLGKDQQNSKTAKTGTLNSGDAVIFFNFRSERMRQIVEMYLFKKPEIGTEPIPNISIATLTTYDELLPVLVAYPNEVVCQPLAKILSDNDYAQAHFAETEKYAHATYFFNGLNPQPFPNEKWFLTPSPKVATYDLKPDMSANEVTDKILSECEKNNFDFVMVNYANADMVGHTGKLDATIKAVETIDAQLKRLMDAFLPETTFLITADHGNAEVMVNPKTGEPDKNHTVNQVPFIVVNPEFKINGANDADLRQTGILADIAPTILHFFGITPPPQMTGSDLTEALKANN